jgi:hypothetical protein
MPFLTAFYVLVMPLLLIQWLHTFIRDAKMSAGQKRLSLVVLVLATLCWPIVLPFVYLELLSHAQKTARQVKLAELKLGINQG